MRAAALAAAALLSLTALPAAADWVVLSDGTRVETRGAWQEKGRLVVFTTTEGRLSSLRSDAVDLAASRRATEEAAAAAVRPAAPAAPPAPPPRTVRTITNADIPDGRPAAPAAAAPAAEATGEGAGAAAAPGAGSLAVRDTTQSTDAFDGHLVVTGSLANTSDRTAAALELTVEAYDPEGDVLAAVPAALDRAALAPGGVTRFEVHFAEVFGGAFGLRFAPEATFLETSASQGAAAAAPPAAEPEQP